MGNLQQCRGVASTQLELDRRDAVYTPNELVSGTVTYSKQTNASVVLNGVIYFKKRKKTRLEKCQITFFSTKYTFDSGTNRKHHFQLQLDDQLPPSFNDKDTYPNISYTVDLLYTKSKDQIRSSLPIRVCPRVQVDRPLLLTPLFFGPVENHQSGVKLEVKVNRAVFTFDDVIQIFYELQNPNQEDIHRTEITLGVYYTIESNVHQQDLCHAMESSESTASKNKLIRSKALLNIPQKLYLPPTYKFQYGRDGEQSSFNLTIDYKIQFKVHLGNEDTVWQVDIPIVICNDTIEPIEIEDVKVEGEVSAQNVDNNADFVE